MARRTNRRSTKVRDPRRMSHGDLAHIVRQIQARLWIELSLDGRDMWSPDKTWDPDTAESIGTILDEYGLRPSRRRVVN